ncbi:Putative uncharacterized protein [Moritella viscosa]|uniref:PAAR-like domain-containing protein n=1 Tax=Moritella viscosa TaxID=80854 RepID=UPI000508FA97|nr:PAAR-like domain-containing protein [Moritella viscosa]CED59244.1 putative uncharacterized phage protein [Moritella viscosa]SHO00639.1 Putative uncharacterized protein [Moritella viscosa]SHO20323.1 Putative uncharacterized protein [Moritella viscosa]
MAVTISADGLSIVHKGSGGEANATLPDVCLTTVGNAVVPLPYGNAAKSADLADGSETVTADGGNSIAIKGCTFTKSTGDSGGDKKGVASGTIEGEAKFIMFSPTVKIEGKGVCRLSDQLTMNKANTMCMGGIMQDSVSVSSEEEGTYTIDITLTYTDGDPVQNATYTIVDSTGAEFKGNLGKNGQASVSGLAGGQYSIEYGEDSRPFTPNKIVPENPYFNPDVTPTELIADTKRGKIGFWEFGLSRISSAASWSWGVILGDFNDDPSVAQIITNAVITCFPGIDQAADVRDVVANLRKLMDEEERKKTENWTNLALTILGFIPSLGSILKGVGKIIIQKGKEIGPDELFAIMRKLGKGNPEKFLRELKWAQYAKQCAELLSDVLIPCINAFDELASYANRMSATVLENTLKSVGLEFKAINSMAPEMFNKAMGEMDDNLARILAKSQKVYPAKKTHDTKSMSQHSSKNDTTNEKSNKSKGKCWLCNRTIKKSAKKNDKKFCKGTDKPRLGDYAKSGNSKTLAKHILNDGWRAGITAKAPSAKHYKDHHWCDARNQTSGNLQAHHVITSETVNDTKWKNYRSHFEYDIDESKNGVFLPSQTDVACQLGVAVHKGPHASGLDYSTVLFLIQSGKEIPDEISKGLKSSKLTYIAAVKRELRKITDLFKKGGFCGSKPDNKLFFTRMRELSHRGVEHIDNFTWTISGFGQDYREGVSIGCANDTTEGVDKKRAPCKMRSDNQLGQHDLVNAKGVIMTKQLVGNKLEVGK